MPIKDIQGLKINNTHVARYDRELFTISDLPLPFLSKHLHHEILAEQLQTTFPDTVLALVFSIPFLSVLSLSFWDHVRHASVSLMSYQFLFSTQLSGQDRHWSNQARFLKKWTETIQFLKGNWYSICDETFRTTKKSSSFFRHYIRIINFYIFKLRYLKNNTAFKLPGRSSYPR